MRRYEQIVIEAVDRYLRVLRELLIEPPFFVILSLLGVNGAFMATSPRQTIVDPHPIDRNRLTAPDVLIERFDADIARELRPAFDSFWNACGISRSLNYDKEGHWSPQQ